MRQFVMIMATLLTLCSYSQTQEEWTKATALAKQYNKHMFVKFGTTWCKFCKKFDKDFEYFRVQIYDNYTYFKVDCESEFGRVLSRRFKVDGYPTFMTIDPTTMKVKYIINAKKLLNSKPAKLNVKIKI